MEEVSDTIPETSHKEIQATEEVFESKINLNQIRLDWIANELKKQEAKKIIDLGCGEGKLLQKLFRDNYFDFGI